MDTSTFILVMDFIGTIAFAVSGALLAIRRDMDLFGVNILAIVTATGGGLIRDLIIGTIPPVMFTSPIYVIISVITANITFLVVAFQKKIHREIPTGFKKIYENCLFWFDTLGLAAFTVDGVHAGINAGYENNLFLLIFLGTLTGVGGGLLRDIFSVQMPYIFVKHVYACASLLGALVMAILYIYTQIPLNMTILIGFGMTLAIRCMAAYFGWNLPRIREL